MNFGYARVSAKDQNLDTQLDELRAAGVDRIFQEKVSGISTSRPELEELLRLLRPGDTVTVARLSRLGRSSAHLLQLVADFTAQDIRFVSLDLGIDTTTPTGRMVLGVFAAFAEYEREGNRERSLAGIALAKSQGKHLGRRPGVDGKSLEKVKTSLAAGLSVNQVAQVTGISLTSVKRYRRLLGSLV